MLLEFLSSFAPLEWLTIGLVIFAAAQFWLQHRTERQRRTERAVERDEEIDRAFLYVWAEHFRLEGLADSLDKRDLVELAFLDVLQPSEVLPRDWSKLTESLAALSREAGWLGGIAIGLCHDIERSISILVSSVHAFARAGNPEHDPTTQIQLIRTFHGPELEPWEKAARTGVRELATLMWDAAKQNPRMALERQLSFSDNLESGFARRAVSALGKRTTLKKDQDNGDSTTESGIDAG
jgi:hypothetical protein